MKKTKISEADHNRIQHGIRLLFKGVTVKYCYPPDKQEKATLTVLEQTALLADKRAVAQSFWVTNGEVFIDIS